MVRCRDTTVANLPCGAGVWAIGRETLRDLPTSQVAADLWPFAL